MCKMYSVMPGIEIKYNHHLDILSESAASKI